MLKLWYLLTLTWGMAMSILHDTLDELIPGLREERRSLLEGYGSRPIATVSVSQIIGGMRHVPALVCDTSVVDPDKGLIVRGTSITRLAGRLPEEVFFLLLTGRLPEPHELADFQNDFLARSKAPAEVFALLEAMPRDSHPMTMLSTAILALEHRSRFRRAYDGGMDRTDHWRPALDDALDLLAVLPAIAAGIYRIRYANGAAKIIAGNPELDWAANLGYMLGSEDALFYEYLRLATVVQSDHEGGHASALAAHTVGSVLSNIYYSLSSAANALAGPLHGRSSQACLEWVLAAIEKYGGEPTEEEIREYTRETIGAGRIVPGYGHAVLRGQDPRYLAILAFGKRHCPRDPIFKTIVQMSRVIPSVLIEQGKVKNPWPNVDAINGALYHHFGITEAPYYTVFFTVALSLGICAQHVLSRALGTPITRPRSVPTSWLKAQLDSDGGDKP